MASTANWLSALTLKMSYGAQGNDNLGTYYASKGLYTIVSNLGERDLGFRPYGYSEPEMGGGRT